MSLPRPSSGLGVGASGWNALLILGAISVVVVVSWGLDRGFDVSDEGLYVLRFSSPETVSPLWRYEALVSPVVSNLAPRLMEFRVARVVLTVLVSVAFAYCVRRWTTALFLESGSESHLEIFSVAVIGSFASYALFPRALSYNSLSLILTVLMSSGLLWYLARVRAGRSTGAACLAIGMLWAFQLFTKFPVALLLLPLPALLWLARFNRGSSPGAWRDSLFVAGGAAIVAFYYQWMIGGFGAWLSALASTSSALASHEPASLIRAYWLSVKSAIKIGLVFKAEIPLLTFLLLRFATRLSRRTFGIATFGLFAWAMVRIGVDGWLGSDPANARRSLAPFLVWIGCSGAATLARDPMPRASAADRREVAGVVVLLLAMPAIASAGTRNWLTMQMTQYMVFWLVAVWIMARAAVPYRSRLLFMTLVLALSITIVTKTLDGYVSHPYGLAGSLLEETVAVPTLARAESLKVHPDVASTLEAVDRLLVERTTFSPGDPLVSLDRMPGLVYLLGGSPPGPAWFTRYAPRGNCSNLSESTAPVSSIFLVVPDDLALTELLSGCEEAVVGLGSHVDLGTVFSLPGWSAGFRVLVPPTAVRAGAARTPTPRRP